MKLTALLVLGPLALAAYHAPDRALSGAPQPATAPAGEFVSPPYDLSSTGIAWNKGLESVLHKDKPILLFQLLGDFERVHC